MKTFQSELESVFRGVFRPFGLSEVHSKVVSTLYPEPGDLPLEEIARRTGYSLASVSGAMKLLGGLGIVQRMRKPGTKKVFFYMEKNLFALNISKLRAAHDNMIKTIRESLGPVLEKYKGRLRSEADRARLRIMQDYYAQVLEFEGLLKKWTRDLERLAAEKRGRRWRKHVS